MQKINKKELHEIFNKLRSKNQTAYNELYEKYYKIIYGIVFSIMKNKQDSEDLTHEIFTKIYKLKVEQLPENNEASWLFTVSKNECFMYLRKTKQNVSLDDIYEISDDSKDIEDVIDTEYFNKLISGLNEQEKMIISLKVLSNFTFSKISKLMNIPIGTVQWKYYKAINSLKVSIGSLVGAAIAFLMVVIRRENNNKIYLNNDENKSQEDLNINEETGIENKSDDLESATESKKESTKESTYTEIKQEENKTSNEDSSKFNVNTISEPDILNTEKINTFDITCISIGIALFIIFIIFFQKYQQKLRRKTSK